MRDLLTDTSMTASALPPEDEDPESSFVFHTPGTVSSQEAMLYRDAAEALAKAAVTRMATLLPCAATATGASETTCLTTFMTTFAVKAYRRPLSTTGTDSDTARLMATFNAGKALGLTFSNTIGFMIETMLQSPQFLYHWEVDPVKAVTEPVPGGTPVVKLGSYELANRLSYALWGTMPDAMLFAAAAANQLGDVASVDAQVRRMLKDAKAAGTMSDFVIDWLDVDGLADRSKDAAIYPMYNEALSTAMLGEIQNFSSTVLTGTGRFDDLMTGTNSFANQALASLYGVSGVTGTALKAVTLNPAQRAGLLTSAAFMSLTGSSSGSHAPRRGKAVFYRFLCGTLPPLMVTPPEPAAASTGGTTRQRFEALTKNACATACHNVMDPLGYAFENYDGIGQYRTMDNNLPVDASTILMLDGQTKNITDGRGLAAALAGSAQAQSCFATQWFRYALGRLDTPQDQASINGAAATFKAATRDVRELLVAMATSRTFRYRTPGTSEILQ
ncbi:MAG: DUF1592 domain-containing protein [Bacteroidota bacterium]